MRRIGAVLVVLSLLAGCGTAQAAASGSATGATGVLTRTLALSRGVDRPLPTTVWYPAVLRGGEVHRHPVVLFSHGLGGLPEHFGPLLAGWAAAGYVVAAPVYPHTNGRVTVRRADIVNQSADAAAVLRAVQALDRAPGDIFAGRIDAGRSAAVGFSAGGTTTLGLLCRGHDRTLRAAVSISGRRPASDFGGSAVPVLVVHGDADRVVPISAGRQAYAALPWGKQFVTVAGQGHGRFLTPGNPAYARISARILGFLATAVPVK